MKLTIKKTDKRHSGNHEWQYLVVVERMANVTFGNMATIQKTADLNAIREWCWTTYGPSCELELWLAVPENTPGKNTHWCWHTNFNNFKIYLRTDKEANWFKMKWL
jgi:hypothetical protein